VLRRLIESALRARVAVMYQLPVNVGLPVAVTLPQPHLQCVDDQLGLLLLGVPLRVLASLLVPVPLESRDSSLRVVMIKGMLQWMPASSAGESGGQGPTSMPSATLFQPA
jgi:hypothetical protein